MLQSKSPLIHLLVTRLLPAGPEHSYLELIAESWVGDGKEEILCRSELDVKILNFKTSLLFGGLNHSPFPRSVTQLSINFHNPPAGLKNLILLVEIIATL